jgi:hypothetical protein
LIDGQLIPAEQPAFVGRVPAIPGARMEIKMGMNDPWISLTWNSLLPAHLETDPVFDYHTSLNALGTVTIELWVKDNTHLVHPAMD